VSRRRKASQPPSVVVGYIRVSTEEQGASGLGLEAQRSAIEAECDRRGWELVEVVADVASGKDFRRDGIAGLLKRCAAGQVGTLMVAKQDRLIRSLPDFGALMASSVRQGWSIVCLDLDVDTTTPAGKLMANVMGAINEFERDVIGLRTKEALAVKRAQGIRLGRPPLMPAELRGRIVAEREAGASFASIAEGLNRDGIPTAQGGAKWWPATVRYVTAGRAIAV
jgi:DNA invertase Pin-like site-specific DNA recombinase